MGTSSETFNNSVGNVPSLVAQRPTVVFLYSGLLFLFVSIGLFILGGWSLFSVAKEGVVIGVPIIKQAGSQIASAALSERERYDFFGAILSSFLGPMLLIASAAICAYLGLQLLKSAGAVAKHVIPPQDYALLSTAIHEGNERAISEYIRLSSLSGTTGTFTKIGLTGLPLATIFLTIVLSLLGIYVPKFLDLAQLTLGAFIGSYVQKKHSDVATPP